MKKQSSSIKSLEIFENQIKLIYKRTPRWGGPLGQPSMNSIEEIELGRLFCLAKPLVYKGFVNWVESNFGINVRTAQNYMNLYRSSGLSNKSSVPFNKSPVYSKSRTEVVYFVQVECGDSYLGPIKIGYANNFKARFQSLRIDNFHDLRILKLINGNMSKEKELHHKFSELRIRGEWFKADKLLTNYIHKLRESEQCTLIREEVANVVRRFE
jgi:hypothetical protein